VDLAASAGSEARLRPATQSDAIRMRENMGTLASSIGYRDVRG
jgi:hypothetical protein